MMLWTALANGVAICRIPVAVEGWRESGCGYTRTKKTAATDDRFLVLSRHYAKPPSAHDKSKSGDKIDGIVALIMALGRPTQEPPEERSVYEDPDFFM